MNYHKDFMELRMGIQQLPPGHFSSGIAAKTSWYEGIMDIYGEKFNTFNLL